MHATCPICALPMNGASQQCQIALQMPASKKRWPRYIINQSIFIVHCTFVAIHLSKVFEL